MIYEALKNGTYSDETTLIMETMWNTIVSNYDWAAEHLTLDDIQDMANEIENMTDRSQLVKSDPARWGIDGNARFSIMCRILNWARINKSETEEVERYKNMPEFDDDTFTDSDACDERNQMGIC